MWGTLDPGRSTNQTARASQIAAETMGDDMSKQVVLGIFPDEPAADTAAHTLKAWDYADDDVKVKTIGVLVLDDDGKVNTHKLGPRTWGKGAGIGVVLAVVAPPTLIAGALAGGALGALHHKSLGIDSAVLERIADALGNGKSGGGRPGRRDASEGGLPQALRTRWRRPGTAPERRRGGRGRRGGSGSRSGRDRRPPTECAGHVAGRSSVGVADLRGVIRCGRSGVGRLDTEGRRGD